MRIRTFWGRSSNRWCPALWRATHRRSCDVFLRLCFFRFWKSQNVLNFFGMWSSVYFLILFDPSHYKLKFRFWLSKRSQASLQISVEERKTLSFVNSVKFEFIILRLEVCIFQQKFSNISTLYRSTNSPVSLFALVERSYEVGIASYWPYYCEYLKELSPNISIKRKLWKQIKNSRAKNVNPKKIHQ